MSRQELLVETVRLRERTRGLVLYELIRGVAGIGRELVRAAWIVGLGFCFYKSASVLAGKTTMADIGIRLHLLSKVEVSVVLAWMVGAGGVTFGVLQMKLRKRVVLDCHSRLAKYERELDPKRSSSMLTPEGEPREEDKEA